MLKAWAHKLATAARGMLWTSEGEMADRICANGLWIHGAEVATSTTIPIEHIACDARVRPINEGTRVVQKIPIARAIA